MSELKYKMSKQLLITKQVFNWNILGLLCSKLAPSNQINFVGPRVGDLVSDWSKEYLLLNLAVSLILATALDLLGMVDGMGIEVKLGFAKVQCL